MAQAGARSKLILIHDEDLLKLVNELKAAGAEAITVNEQRVVASTEIRCAGPTISVNNNRISPPYVIQAIGDPAGLESALKMRGVALLKLCNSGGYSGTNRKTRTDSAICLRR